MMIWVPQFWALVGNCVVRSLGICGEYAATSRSGAGRCSPSMISLRVPRERTRAAVSRRRPRSASVCSPLPSCGSSANSNACDAALNARSSFFLNPIDYSNHIRIHKHTGLMSEDFEEDDLGPAIFNFGGELCGSGFRCLWGVCGGVSFGDRSPMSWGLWGHGYHSGNQKRNLQLLRPPWLPFVAAPLENHRTALQQDGWGFFPLVGDCVFRGLGIYGVYGAASRSETGRRSPSMISSKYNKF